MAAALAVPLCTVGPAPPAQAAETCDYGFICDIRDFGEMALVMALLSADGSLTPDEIVQMTSDIIGAFQGAEADIIAHVDALATYPWKAAARQAILEFDDIDRFSEDTLEDWAQDVTGHAIQATEAFRTVWTAGSRYDISVAMHTLYPIALTARVRAGFSTSTLRTYYRQALQEMVTRLEPQCGAVTGDLDPHPSVHLVEHHCTAPDGTAVIFRDYQVDGVWRDGPHTPEQMKTELGRGTSWDAARMILQAMDQ